MKDIIIVGAGGFGREVAWLIEDINYKSNQWNLLGFLDDNAELHGKSLNNIPVLGSIEWLNGKNDIYYVCAIGNPQIKENLVHKCDSYGAKAATLIHPSVIISKYNEIGDGCIICAGSIITVNIRIGNHVIINIDCTIGHDAIIEDFCTILPSVNVSGAVHLNRNCDIGTGSSIIQGIEIGECTIVGAGAVVAKDLPSNCTAVGVPAKPIKFRDIK